MARDCHRQAVRATCLGHGAHRLRRTDALGDVGIAGGTAGGNLTQGLPDAFLERRAAYVQRQVEADGRGFNKPYNLGDQLLEIMVGTDQVRAAKLVLQIADQLVRVVPEQNRANAAFTLRNQNRPQGALANGKADVVVLSGSAVVSRFHA